MHRFKIASVDEHSVFCTKASVVVRTS